MRIAVCMSGHMRNYEDNVGSFFHNLARGGHEFDVFVHTWDKMGFPAAWHGCDSKKPENTFKHLGNIHGKLLPRSVIIEPSFDWDMSSFKRPGLQKYHENFPMMFYKIHKCDEMRKTRETLLGQKYDLVVRTRPDVRYLSLVDFNALDKSCLHIPPMPAGYAFPHQSYNDQIAIGPPDLMSVYSAATSKVYEYADGTNEKGELNYYGPERFLRWYLGGERVPVKSLRMQYMLTRMNGRHMRVL